MREERILNVLLSPILSEKVSRSGHPDIRQYVFKIADYATKLDVKHAIEKIFSVRVRTISICRVKGKPVRSGRRKDYKKAYILLDKNQELEMAF